MIKWDEYTLPPINLYRVGRYERYRSIRNRPVDGGGTTTQRATVSNGERS